MWLDVLKEYFECKEQVTRCSEKTALHVNTMWLDVLKEYFECKEQVTRCSERLLYRWSTCEEMFCKTTLRIYKPRD